MTREEKAAEITNLQDRFGRATVALVTETAGMTVANVQELRRSLKQAGGEYKVAKNTLAKLAVADTAYKRLDDLLVGPTGLVFGYDDPIAVTKVLVEFAKDNEKLAIRAGLLDEDLLEPDAVTELAKMPSKEVLLSKLLALLQAPASQLLRTIQEPGAQMARLLASVRDRIEP